MELEDPWTAIVRELRDRGAVVAPADARRALEAEMTYYRANHAGAVDAPSLELLRDRCAAVLRDHLPAPARDLPISQLRSALLAGLRFRAFPDAAPTLDGLRAAGRALAIVSNWDVSLHAVLEQTGLAGRVDAVVTSAEVGVAKPDPAIFRIALERLGGLRPTDALHVGDDPASDLAGARAAGIPVLLVDRASRGDDAAPGVISSLGALLDRLGPPAGDGVKRPDPIIQPLP